MNIIHKVKCFFGHHEIIEKKYFLGRSKNMYGIELVFEICKNCDSLNDGIYFYEPQKIFDENLIFKEVEP